MITLYAKSSTLFFIKYYSIFMALAMFAGCFVSYQIAKKYYKNINLDFILDLYPILIISGIICARLYYVCANWQYFSTFKSEIIMINHGGISIHGAILGGFIAGAIFCKIKKVKILDVADIMSYGMILAQAIGRMGNFFNQEAFGAPILNSNAIIKLFIDEKYRPEHFKNFSYFHPTFFYEILWNLTVFLILFFILRKIKTRKSGVIFFSYLILYSIGRLIIEGIRIDSVLYINGIAIAQIASIILIITGILGIFYVQKISSEKS